MEEGEIHQEIFIIRALIYCQQTLKFRFRLKIMYIKITVYYRNVFVIFSLHTEMDENRCANGIIRVANYTTFMQRKNNENIPYNLITNEKYICKENALLL